VKQTSRKRRHRNRKLNSSVSANHAEEAAKPLHNNRSVGIIFSNLAISDTETGFMTLLSNYVANQAEKANQNTDTVEEQVKSYLNTTVEPIDCDVYKWWHQRKTSRLYKQAMKYLVIPATSCPSERIFSTAGYILNQKRTRLTGHHVDQLLFLNQNLY
jgi:hypothetical protein